MTRTERLQAIEASEKRKQELLADIADRRERIAAGDVVREWQMPVPGPTPYHPPAAAAAPDDASGWDAVDARIARALDVHEAALIDATVGYIAEQLRGMRAEIAALTEQVAAQKCDLEIMRAGNIAKFQMIGRRHAA